MRSRLPFVLMGLVAAVIAVATLLPDGNAVYGSLWFKILWGLIVVSGSVVIVRAKMWKRPAVFAMHVSFIVILLGALMTSLTSSRGMLHLRQGKSNDAYMTEGGRMEHLPAEVRLDTFYVTFYPGTSAPQDYVSVVSCRGEQHRISMNHIAVIDGCRLYQTSYDQDLKGTVLSVNHDPIGTPLTYAGYALFLLSFLLMLWKPLCGRLLRGKSGKAVLVAALLAVGFGARAQSLPVVGREVADSLERTVVMWNSRPVPAGVMTEDFLRKIYGKPSFNGLTPTQVAVSWTMAPQEWNNAKIIKLKKQGYKCLNDFIDYSESVPRLKGMGVSSQADEKVGLVLMLLHGDLASEPSEDVSPLSERRISAELFYARVPWSLIGIALCLLCAFAGIFKNRRISHAAKGLTFAFMLFHFVLRWCLSGHIPLTNTYETLWFVSACLLPFIPVGSASTMMVSWLVGRNPQITPLMPVLHSPWLSAHVSIIMLAYALLILSYFRRSFLRPGVSLLAIGIFLGAIWANVSWGAYWTWDPKESWALVTLIVYSIPLHTKTLPWFRSDRNYRIYSLIALAALLMTYFGVNYLLGGLHSYA